MQSAISHIHYAGLPEVIELNEDLAFADAEPTISPMEFHELEEFLRDYQQGDDLLEIEDFFALGELDLNS